MPTDAIHTALAHCLSAPPDSPTTESVAQWWPQWQPLAQHPASPFALALYSGFLADRVGWAFAGGYQAALRALLPALAPTALAALCVTEAGGNRPRDIQTTLTPSADGGYRLDGAKRWTTLGPQGTHLLVVARLDQPLADRPVLRVAQVDAGQSGVAVEPMPPTPFVPEVPHAQLRFQAVSLPAHALLPGDGYTTCVKPFRTLEDIHVTAAVLAYLLREARARHWPADFAERVAATLLALAGCAALPPDDPTAHIALSGALQAAAQCYRDAGAHWPPDDADPGAARWRRDAGLFGVAATARGQRTARAWERLTGS